MVFYNNVLIESEPYDSNPYALEKVSIRVLQMDLPEVQARLKHKTDSERDHCRDTLLCDDEVYELRQWICDKNQRR